MTRIQDLKRERERERERECVCVCSGSRARSSGSQHVQNGSFVPDFIRLVAAY